MRAICAGVSVGKTRSGRETVAARGVSTQSEARPLKHLQPVPQSTRCTGDDNEVLHPAQAKPGKNALEYPASSLQHSPVHEGRPSRSGAFAAVLPYAEIPLR